MDNTNITLFVNANEEINAATIQTRTSGQALPSGSIPLAVARWDWAKRGLQLVVLSAKEKTHLYAKIALMVMEGYDEDGLTEAEARAVIDEAEVCHWI